MSRFIAEFACNKPDDMIKFISEDFFLKEGFEVANVKGEIVWKKGVGMMTAPQFVKLIYGGGKVHIEAWLKYAILPGVYAGEMGLDGFMGALPKANLKKRVDTLIGLINQLTPADAVPQGAPAAAVQGTAVPQAGVPQGAPQQAAAAQPAPVPVAVHNPTGKAVLALVMGVLSIPISWYFSALIGIVLGIVGITAGITGIKSTSKVMAIFGLVLSIIGAALGAVGWILNIVLLAA